MKTFLLCVVVTAVLMGSKVTTPKGTAMALIAIDSQLQEAGVDASFQQALFFDPCFEVFACPYGTESFELCRQLFVPPLSCGTCINFAILDCEWKGAQCDWTTFEIDACKACAEVAQDDDDGCDNET